MSASVPIQLTEYEPVFFEHEEIALEVGRQLWSSYRHQISVDFPSPKTDNRWRLVANGWVGHIPLTTACHVSLQPKVDLSNIFRMLEYAYGLRSFHLLDGLVDCHSLAEFYEQLALILARQILERGRKGYYRAYVAKTAELSYLRGRLNVLQTIRTPGRVKLECHYQNHTADVKENRLLAWTLWRITRGQLCTARTLPTIRRAYRSLQGLVTLQPHPAKACLGRLYNRLNADYQPMHILCRFFLEHSGPTHQPGDRATVPFLVDMARLFELFVAEWLRAHPPKGLKLKAQERVNLDDSGALHVDIDLVLSDANSGLTKVVLDTKYKVPDKPTNADIYQVVAYAKAKRCHEAILIYPIPLAQPLDIMWDDIRVRSLTFTLDGDLEQAGRRFVETLKFAD